MTDLTSNGVPKTKRRVPTWEYRFYFAVLFLISLPWAVVSWALGLEKPDSENAERGVIGRAWHQAAVITPTIFSA